MKFKSNLFFFKEKIFLQVFLVLFCLLPFFLGLDSIPPLDRDESRFAQSSFQMLETKDYINIKFQDEMRAKKPVGIYWLQSFSANIFGAENIFSYRLPSFVGALISLAIIWFFSIKLFGRHSAQLIVMFLSVNLLFLSEAHIAKTDSFLLSTICAQQFFLFLILLEKMIFFNSRYIYPILMWLCISIGILIKGPISIVLFITTLTSFAILKKDIKLFLLVKPILGIFIIVLIVLPWLASIQSSTGGMFLEKAIIEDFFSKLISGQESHGAYPGYYFLITPFILWPLTCFLPLSILFIFQNISNVAIKFLLCWIVPFWLIIELVPTKLFHYPLPVIPAMIMLICASLIFFEKNEIKLRNINSKIYLFIASMVLGLGGLILSVAILILTIKFHDIDEKSIIYFSIICVLVSFIVYVISILQNLKLFFKVQLIERFNIYFKYFCNLKSILLLSSIFYILNFGFILPNIKKIFPSKLIFNELKLINYESISAVGFHEPSLVFLLKGKVLLSNSHEAAIFLAEGKNNLVLIEKNELKQFLQSAESLDIKIKQLSSINGYNYSKGRSVKIYFYKSIH